MAGCLAKDKINNMVNFNRQNFSRTKENELVDCSYYFTFMAKRMCAIEGLASLYSYDQFSECIFNMQFLSVTIKGFPLQNQKPISFLSTDDFAIFLGFGYLPTDKHERLFLLLF